MILASTLNLFVVKWFMRIRVTGTIFGITENASVEWRIKNCHSTNLEADIKKWTHETHSGTLICGECNKQPFITGFNLEEKIVKCVLCGAINEI